VSTASKDILVLGPDLNYYQSLLPNFRDMPELANEASVLDRLVEFATDAITTVAESLTIETLTDPPLGDVSAENNSSTVILLRVDNRKILLTGDAGPEALERAANYASSLGIALDDLYLLQVPHHGSRRNVGPTILNRIKAKNAVVSVAKEGAPKHPSKRVTNALKRRDAVVCATRGSAVAYLMPHQRPGWSDAPQVPFYPQVEAD
jgi:hypothetical protein